MERKRRESYASNGRLQGAKNNGKFRKTLTPKSSRGRLRRGLRPATVSNCSQWCSDLTGKILVFWIVDGRLWELNSRLQQVASHRKGNPKTYMQYKA